MKLKLVGQINKGVIDPQKAKKMFGDATKQILVKTAGRKFEPGEDVFQPSPKHATTRQEEEGEAALGGKDKDGKAARRKNESQNRRMGVLDPLKIAAMSLKAQKEEDHTRLKVEMEEQFSKLLLSLKTSLLKKAQTANKKMDSMIKDQREHDDEVAATTAKTNGEFLEMNNDVRAT